MATARAKRSAKNVTLRGTTYPLDAKVRRAGGKLPKARVLEFPADRSIGTLLVRAADGSWSEYGPARGLIPIARGVAAALRLGFAGNLADLRQLNAGDLQGLDASGRDWSPAELNQLSRLSGLEWLDLSLGHINVGARLPHFANLTSLRLAQARLPDGFLADLDLPELHTLLVVGATKSTQNDDWADDESDLL